jgi:hypothetical protein
MNTNCVPDPNAGRTESVSERMAAVFDDFDEFRFSIRPVAAQKPGPGRRCPASPASGSAEAVSAILAA